MWGLPVMRDIPIPLRVYAVVSVVVSVAFAVTSSSRPGLEVFSVAFIVVMVFFLLRGSQVAWLLLMASFVISLVTLPFGSVRWWTIPIALFGGTCLLWPSSRAYVWKPRPARYPAPLPSAAGPEGPPIPVAVQTTWDPEAQSDAERPSGWYVDREEPGRMHYWSADQRGWLGTTKTPNKIFRTL
jgi:hypothetical protein